MITSSTNEMTRLPSAARTACDDFAAMRQGSSSGMAFSAASAASAGAARRRGRRSAWRRAMLGDLRRGGTKGDAGLAVEEVDAVEIHRETHPVSDPDRVIGPDARHDALLSDAPVQVDLAAERLDELDHRVEHPGPAVLGEREVLRTDAEREPPRE